jgi:hypothetical protein
MLIIGNDFRPRYQQIVMLGAESAEVEERRHERRTGEVRTLYAGLLEAAEIESAESENVGGNSRSS